MPHSLVESLAWIVEQRVAEEPGFDREFHDDPLPFLRLVLTEALGDDDPDFVAELARSFDLVSGGAPEPLQSMTVDDPVALALDCRAIEYERKRLPG